MVRFTAFLAFAALALCASSGGADNQVAWTVRVGDVAVPVPPGLFAGRPLPIKGTRWHCVADKALRQDTVGNTFSTLTIRCDDAETSVSASASCAIGAHDNRQLGFERVEKTTNVKNESRGECADGHLGF